MNLEIEANSSRGVEEMKQEINYTQLTDENFRKEVLDYSGLVLVKFTKESYGGLHIIAPMMKEVLYDYKEKIKVGKLDVEISNRIANQYRIREIPTVLFFRNGLVVDYLIGTFRKKELRAVLQTLLDA
jgi:thioredoxin 1